ncbi:caspase family protein [Azospirillum rugosum]|uniref:WD40 repeat protein n=1 Tax=Azospirillum rugosum TaxID=416170 RepID=A0ABS4SGN3_9PROT|nr:caspase family protein [Azospirillum rugosum]MBP2291722.1 WD40 repeat protein [Azospirillum rugosum]MDQ0524466.1 WD40 repeat protein [Azospirillum rugosum]
MDALFRHSPRNLLTRRIRRVAGLLPALLALTPLPALSQSDKALYDRPTLVVDPGRHTAIIKRASVDAAGRFAVTGSDDKTVRVWSMEDGTLQRTIRLPAGPGHVGKAFAVAISPDGSLIVVGGWTAGSEESQQIYIFDRASGALLKRIGGLPNVVHHLVFSLDGLYLAATLGKTEGLRVYDRAADWTEIARDTDYGGDSYGAAFSKDGRLATVSYDGRIRLYGPDFAKPVIQETRAGRRPYGIAFSPDGKRLAVGFRDSASVEILDGRTLARQPGPDTSGMGDGALPKVAWSTDGRTLLAGGSYIRTDGKSSLVTWSGAGWAERDVLTATDDIYTSVLPLAGGGMLVAAADPYLASLNADGVPLWVQGSPKADFRMQKRTLSASADGTVVDFGYEVWGKAPVRFDLRTLRLSAIKQDGTTVPPRQTGLPIANWEGSDHPTLDGMPLPLIPFEWSRSMAIAPDGQGFVLGADWSLRAFDAKGQPQWSRHVPSVVWAVNVTGDGRLVVAAYANGTIRWHRMDDGRELLAFMPLVDRVNWVAWTPEGFYAATPGARGVLKWHINHGWDAAAEAIPVADIPNLYRPDALPLVLREMETARALGLADMAAAREAVRRRTGAAPGARLHVLTVGIDNYGEKAKGLGLTYAAKDARDVMAALDGEQGTPYGKVLAQSLTDKDATRGGILDALSAMRAGMRGSDPTQDLVVILLSGHGAVIDGEFHVIAHGVDTLQPSRMAAASLSLSELRRQVELLAQKGRVLLLLDTCHSGAVGGTRAPNAKALSAALAGSNVTVITSSSADQKSYESARWGHGAFTFALLEAFGKVADTDRNGMISASELVAHLAKRVPDLTEGAQTTGMEMRFESDLFAAGL